MTVRSSLDFVVIEIAVPSPKPTRGTLDEADNVNSTALRKQQSLNGKDTPKYSKISKDIIGYRDKISNLEWRERRRGTSRTRDSYFL